MVLSYGPSALSILEPRTTSRTSAGLGAARGLASSDGLFPSRMLQQPADADLWPIPTRRQGPSLVRGAGLAAGEGTGAVPRGAIEFLGEFLFTDEVSHRGPVLLG